MDRSDEYYEGYDAFCAGLTDADNPYEAGTDKGMDWFDGHMDAECDHMAPEREDGPQTEAP
ncbi:Dnase type 1 [Burkholderia phage BcepSauron]|uniref:Dnase type 1 n=1 Tax=Burkholderia phage BcepSauron TaxID=2530033 RepID=A0A482MNC4_9CAUD|nr:Dnase type 1 [Burkholderia phage BcepSauron]QBQ74712.1 Dnase type 1 [Burkholderia phage BcepSauron]